MALLTGVVVIAGLVHTPTSASARVEGRATHGVVTPVIASLVPQKAIVPVLGSDRRYHVLYELVVTNTTSRRATLHSVQVLDARGRRRLRTLTVKDMTVGGAMHQLDRAEVANTRIPAGQTRVLLVSVSFGSRRAIPRRLEHRFSLTAVNPFTSRTSRFRYVIRPVRLSGKRPPTLAPPLEGPGWLASDGCCSPGGHFSALFGLDGKLQGAERYAIDWIRVDPDGRIYHGNPAVLANWSGYGAKILAVGDGVVTEAIDGRKNQVPLVKPSTLEFGELPGNLVVLRLRGGLSAVYAHLIPGSLRVRVGQHVHTGQVLGLLGNSGGSLAPHLHFHIVNGPSAAASDGYPYTLGHFKLAARASIEDLSVALKGGAGFPPRDRLKPRARSRQLPLGFTVDDFPR